MTLRQTRRIRRISIALALGAAASIASAQQYYTVTNLGEPAGASSAIGVRMNNLGQVAGWSQFFGGGPNLRGWVWSPGTGYEILPPPPGFDGWRAMDINDGGVVGGDGGFDSGLAWRYENGEFDVTGGVGGMPIAYLGGINSSGDIAGTAKDSQIVTADLAFLDINGGDLLTLTPGGGRAVDVNDAVQVCGHSQGPFTDFEAYRWEEGTGLTFLGTLGLARSFAARMNDHGDVVGTASSASGNTDRAWIYTDGAGMQEIPAPFTNASFAVSINNDGHVVGFSSRSGPDLNWLWTGGGAATTDISDLIDPAIDVNVIEVKDINDRGQILVQVFDNRVPDFRMLILTPPGVVVCYPDCTGDEVLDIFDFICFQDAFVAGDPYADCDGNSTLDIFDFICFQDAFVAGCP